MRGYWQQFMQQWGRGWNQFWFLPSSARPLAAVRILVGLLAAYSLLTYWPDLAAWQGDAALVPRDVVGDIYGNGRSLLEAVPAAWLPAWLIAAATADILLAAGWGGRVVAVAAAVGTISWMTSLPVLYGELEAVLAFLLIYLAVGEASACYAVATPAVLRPLLRPGQTNDAPPRSSPLNTVAIRLIQLHTMLVCLMTGLALVAATDGPWWSGEGMWLAAARPGLALVDLSWLAGRPRIVAAWSHLMLGYLLAAPVLIWLRLWRPAVVGLGILLWIAFGLASGSIEFSLAMIAGLAAFVEVGRSH